MAMGDNLGLGLVKRTSSFGRKRILILNHMDFDSIDVATPKNKQFLESKSGYYCEKSLLEALPQEILVILVRIMAQDDLVTPVNLIHDGMEDCKIQVKVFIQWTQSYKNNPTQVSSMEMIFIDSEVPVRVEGGVDGGLVFELLGKSFSDPNKKEDDVKMCWCGDLIRYTFSSGTPGPSLYDVKISKFQCVNC